MTERLGTPQILCPAQGLTGLTLVPTLATAGLPTPREITSNIGHRPGPVVARNFQGHMSPHSSEANVCIHGAWPRMHVSRCLAPWTCDRPESPPCPRAALSALIHTQQRILLPPTAPSLLQRRRSLWEWGCLCKCHLQSGGRRGCPHQPCPSSQADWGFRIHSAPHPQAGGGVLTTSHSRT